MTICSCGDPVTHDTIPAVCCWCHVVELARPRDQTHRSCVTAASRIEKIQTRFRSAIQAEREAIVRVVEGVKVPLDAMPPQVREQMRRSPDYVLGIVVDLVTKNLVTLIRTRVDPVPSAKGRA